ncbi:glycosyltransferase family 2 protein [Aequorivita sp. H23M31]|uniref:Glycosyltransferase family 2 protein n=1 Tax=Aequorivita ciconiae TaxID=2494375 RepID=A0A410G299_9FLAO|nr:glycosyltransferase family 2 protein [Aequorivita sp. H23M31]QAA81369.1 glycosyltransferase family 2 protein [Aequorivita sp. H23M31]
MGSPLVSVIIPTFNRSHLIGETLDSVLAQTYQNWECIVIDDGSTDKTQEVMAAYLAKDSRFQYHHRPKDRLPGGNAARNYGFELSNGEYVQWFDDDDIMLPGFVESKIKVATEEISLIISPITYWNSKDDSKNFKAIKVQNSLYEDYLCWKIKVMTPSVLFKKSFLEDKKLFSSRILRGQETEFFLRLFYKLPITSYIVLDESKMLYRQHGETKSHRNKTYVPEFMNSTFIIYFENYLKLNGREDEKAKGFCYRHLLGIFYHSIYNKDITLANKIIQDFFTVLYEKDKWKGTEMIVMGRLFIFFRRGVWKFIARWKKFEFE